MKKIKANPKSAPANQVEVAQVEVAQVEVAQVEVEVAPAKQSVVEDTTSCDVSALLQTSSFSLDEQILTSENTGPLDVSRINDYPQSFIESTFKIYEKLGIDTKKAKFFVHGQQHAAAELGNKKVKIVVRPIERIDMLIGYGLMDILRAEK